MPDQTPLCQTNEDEETKLSIKYTQRERERLRDADARTRTGPSLRRAESGERLHALCQGALTKELGPGPGAVAGLSGGGSARSASARTQPPSHGARGACSQFKSMPPTAKASAPASKRKPKLRWVAPPGRGSEFSGQITLGAALEEPRRRPVA